MIAAVPVSVASALNRKAYYFVPLTVTQGEDTVIADRYDVALSDNAVCHRNLDLGDAQCVFISTRLMDDKFSVAFEFYINVGHALVERAGVSQAFADLAWQQAESGVRGETSMDAWEARKFATAHGPDAEKYKNEYLASSFADAISIYLLAVYLDVDYYDLRERDYPRRHGRTPAQDRRDLPAQSRVRIQHLLPAAVIGGWQKIEATRLMESQPPPPGGIGTAPVHFPHLRTLGACEVPAYAGRDPKVGFRLHDLASSLHARAWNNRRCPSRGIRTRSNTNAALG